MKKYDRKGMRPRQKKQTGDRKGESNDSPQIPDRRETSDIPGLPSGSVNHYMQVLKLTHALITGARQ